MDANTITIIIACITVFVSVISGTIVAVWTVSSIKTTTSTLSISIDHLAQSMSEHRDWLSTVDTKVDGHGEDIATIKAHLKLTEPKPTGE